MKFAVLMTSECILRVVVILPNDDGGGDGGGDGDNLRSLYTVFFTLAINTNLTCLL